jgi:hypothetical protein
MDSVWRLAMTREAQRQDLLRDVVHERMVRQCRLANWSRWLSRWAARLERWSGALMEMAARSVQGWEGAPPML